MTMSLDDAIASVQRFAALFESVQVIAGEIKSARLVEQLTREATDKRDAMMKEVAQAKDALQQANNAVADAKAKLKTAERKADETVSDAEDRAKAVVVDARSKADSLLAVARSDAAAIIQSAKDDAAKTQHEINDLSVMAKALDAEVTAKSTELNKINAQIEQARDLLKRFIA